MTACPACGGTAFEHVPYPRAGRHYDGPAFTAIAVCHGCGMGVAEPRATQAQLDAFYHGGGYWGGTGGAGQSLHARNQCEHRARFLADRAPPAFELRVLDVGAGEGWLGSALRRIAGARVVAYDFVEPDPRLRELAASAGGPAGRGFARLEDAAGPYEIVCLNQVLEHVADPVAFAADAARRLDPAGVLYVESPNADHRFKPDVFPHSLFFSPTALRRVCEQTGLETLACEAFGRHARTVDRAAGFAARAGFRLALAAGAERLAQRLDNAIWDYAARPEGIWLRWIGRRAGD
ncbi:MAG: class I SAM-dependent methyltransferase [Pseudomonadota bacterium]